MIVQEIKYQIMLLKSKLNNTNYIDNELTEAISDYIATGDNTHVMELRVQYADVLAQRQQWRTEINRLENQLKED